jgi:uncharacterized protein YoxC
MGELTGIIIGVSVVVLTWAVAKLNEKVDKHIRKFQRFEDALRKNATGRTSRQTVNQSEKHHETYQH